MTKKNVEEKTRHKAGQSYKVGETVLPGGIFQYRGRTFRAGQKVYDPIPKKKEKTQK